MHSANQRTASRGRAAVCGRERGGAARDDTPRTPGKIRSFTQMTGSPQTQCSVPANNPTSTRHLQKRFSPITQLRYEERELVLTAVPQPTDLWAFLPPSDTCRGPAACICIRLSRSFRLGSGSDGDGFIGGVDPPARPGLFSRAGALLHL